MSSLLNSSSHRKCRDQCHLQAARNPPKHPLAVGNYLKAIGFLKVFYHLKASFWDEKQLKTQVLWQMKTENLCFFLGKTLGATGLFWLSATLSLIKPGQITPPRARLLPNEQLLSQGTKEILQNPAFGLILKTRLFGIKTFVLRGFGPSLSHPKTFESPWLSSPPNVSSKLFSREASQIFSSYQWHTKTHGKTTPLRSSAKTGLLGNQNKLWGGPTARVLRVFGCPTQVSRIFLGSSAVPDVDMGIDPWMSCRCREDAGHKNKLAMCPFLPA